jgi:diphthine-ammonia ligase
LRPFPNKPSYSCPTEGVVQIGTSVGMYFVEDKPSTFEERSADEEFVPRGADRVFPEADSEILSRGDIHNRCNQYLCKFNNSTGFFVFRVPKILNFIALVSGGKDGVFAIRECIRLGHSPVCLANLCPPEEFTDGDINNENGNISGNISNDLDSFMIQSVGHEVLPGLSFCLNIPIVRRCTRGLAKHSKLDYPSSFQNQEIDNEDEVEDLFQLLYECKKKFPQVTAVCSGAVLSNYQRLRVETVCKRLGLHTIAPLWGCSQRWLVREMCSHKTIENNEVEERKPVVEAVIVKVAAHGLTKEMIGQRIHLLRPRLEKLALTNGVGECGEGGEYESIVLDGANVLFPCFKLVLDDIDIISSGSGSYYSKIRSWHVERKHQMPIITIDKQMPIVTNDNDSINGIPSLTELKRRVAWSKEINHGIEEIPTWPRFDASIPAESKRETFPSISAGSTNIIVLSVSSSLHLLKKPLDATMDCLEKARILLSYEGLTMGDVCNCHVYLQDMADFESVNSAFSRVFTQDQHPPSRSAIEVKSKLEVTLSPAVKIDFLALRGGSIASLKGNRTFRSTLFVSSRSGWAPQCIGPYCQANIIMNKLVLPAGQIGLDPFSMTLLKGKSHLDQGIELDSKAQCAQALRNISRVLASCSSSLPKALVILVFVTNFAKTCETERNSLTVTNKLVAYESILNNVMSWSNGNLQKNKYNDGEAYDDEEEDFAVTIKQNENGDTMRIITTDESGVDQYPLSDSAFEPPVYQDEFLKLRQPPTSSTPLVVLINISKLPRNALVEIEVVCTTDSEKISRRVLSERSLEASSTSSRIRSTVCVNYSAPEIMSAMTITMVDSLSNVLLQNSTQAMTGDIEMELAVALSQPLSTCLKSGVIKKGSRLLRLFVATSFSSTVVTNDKSDCSPVVTNDRFINLLSNCILDELCKDGKLSDSEGKELLPVVTCIEVQSVLFTENIDSKFAISSFSRGVTAVLTEFA